MRKERRISRHAIQLQGAYTDSPAHFHPSCKCWDLPKQDFFLLDLLLVHQRCVLHYPTSLILFNCVMPTQTKFVNGLKSFSYQSMRLYKWTGDPCLPSNSTWEWLSCNDKDPPRVTAIYLSGYNLEGYLQNFGQMEALEIIDLHNNNLRGPIPDFLGEFPNLRVLNLANNNFEGSIPKSILNNNRISFNASGNPDLKFPKNKKKIGLIVGLTIGMLIVVVVLCLTVTAFLRRSRKRREQEAARGEPRHLQVLNDHEDSEVGQYGQLAK